ncbi:MAG: CBS domain-containing protein [Nocardioidaceae bacterium]
MEEACAETGYSRFPVVDETGAPIGYLHIKDTLQVDPLESGLGWSRTNGSAPLRPSATATPSWTR